MIDKAAALMKRPGATKFRLPRFDAFAWFGVVSVALAFVAAAFGPWLTPYAPRDIVALPFEPAGTFLLGTDVLGRDVLSRLVVGCRLTLFTALSATTLGFLIGVAFGFFSGTKGRWVDEVGSWIINVLLSFPPLMLSLLVISALSAETWVLVGTVGFIHAPRVARVARALAISVATQPFVEVSRARGDPTAVILARDILPNTVTPLAVEFGLRLTYSILMISSLSFIGLGIQPPDADWGSMVRENIVGLQLGVFPAVLAPALAIALLSVGLNFIVDWAGRRSAREIPEELS